MEIEEHYHSSGDYGVFVSDIARGVTDEQLKAEFSKIGEVVEAVVVKNKHSGETKGYGFVKFLERSDAQAAIVTNNPPSFKDSISGKTQVVKITQADSKNQIHIGHIPKGMSEADVKIELEEISGVTLKSFDFESSSKSNGYASFKDHDSTIKAIKLIQKSNKYTASLTPSNGLPQGASKVLFVRGIKSQSEGDQLRKILGTDLIEKIIVPLDQTKNVPIGHAFIYCNSTLDAKTIMESNKTVEFNGKTIHIAWGLPKQKKMEGGGYFGSSAGFNPALIHPYHPHDYPYFLPPSSYPEYYYPTFSGPFVDPRRSGYGGKGASSYDHPPVSSHHHGGHHGSHPPPPPHYSKSSREYFNIPPPPHHGRPYGGHSSYQQISRGANSSGSNSDYYGKPPTKQHRYAPY